MIDTDMQNTNSPFTAHWATIKDQLQNRTQQLLAFGKEQLASADAGAYALLQLAALALHCWNGHSLFVAAVEPLPYQQKLRTALEYFAGSLSAKAGLWAARAQQTLPASGVGK
jgi:hypothetical protein